jgi:hypothetical protein
LISASSLLETMNHPLRFRSNLFKSRVQLVSYWFRIGEVVSVPVRCPFGVSPARSGKTRSPLCPGIKARQLLHVLHGSFIYCFPLPPPLPPLSLPRWSSLPVCRAVASAPSRWALTTAPPNSCPLVLTQPPSCALIRLPHLVNPILGLARGSGPNAGSTLPHPAAGCSCNDALIDIPPSFFPPNPALDLHIPNLRHWQQHGWISLHQRLRLGYHDVSNSGDLTSADLKTATRPMMKNAAGKAPSLDSGGAAAIKSRLKTHLETFRRWSAFRATRKCPRLPKGGQQLEH